MAAIQLSGIYNSIKMEASIATVLSSRTTDKGIAASVKLKAIGIKGRCIAFCYTAMVLTIRTMPLSLFSRSVDTSIRTGRSMSRQTVPRALVLAPAA